MVRWKHLWNYLQKEEGTYEELYEGSPVSKGIFQFDMWGIAPRFKKMGLDKT